MVNIDHFPIYFIAPIHIMCYNNVCCRDVDKNYKLRTLDQSPYNKFGHFENDLDTTHDFFLKWIEVYFDNEYINKYLKSSLIK